MPYQAYSTAMLAHSAYYCPRQAADKFKTDRLTAFEYTSSELGERPQNTLLFIGGLGDGLRTVRYVSELVKALPKNWRLVEVLLSSSYGGWGTSSLSKDAEEISACVKYFGNTSQRIVLMGHSTGCQDCMEYVVGSRQSLRTPIQGVILQAPVSDREAMVLLMGEEQYTKAAKAASDLIDSGRAKDAVPEALTLGFFGAACSAERWYSLSSPPPKFDGKDDYFSSDLDDSRLKESFGKWNCSGYAGDKGRNPALCILYGGSDEYVPSFVDKEQLVQRWTKALKAEGGLIDEINGGVIPAATHTMAGLSEVVQDVLGRVVRFLSFVEQHKI
jgi:pimeloyl-ACP methyl ester carboxylesterase